MAGEEEAPTAVGGVPRVDPATEPMVVNGSRGAGAAAGAGAGPLGQHDTQGSDDAGDSAADRQATGMAVVAAGASILGFVSLFRLKGGWDHSQARAFRRLIGIKLESVAGISLGLIALQRLRGANGDRRGIPFAVVGIALGLSNVMRGLAWLRGDRR